MIQYSFPTAQPQNFQKIISLIETKYSIVMHTENPLPSTLTNIQGSLGLSNSPSGSIIFITFFESSTEYSLSNDSKTIVYQSLPMTIIPTELKIQELIKGLI